MNWLIALLSGHSSYITHLDWSEDSQYIRSNSGDYEVLFWNATTCRQVTSVATTRDIRWATNYCPISFSTVGVWPESADGTDINSCTRSHDCRLAATGDDFGKVKLYAYPVTQPKGKVLSMCDRCNEGRLVVVVVVQSLCHQHAGHAAHVTSVRFLHDSSRLLSAGGRDAALAQWLVD
ncbi:hypothetical protein ACJJTC_009762 [Scirpophaga incertulas]